MLPHTPQHDTRSRLDRTAFHLAAHAWRERRETLTTPGHKAPSRALRGASRRRARASRRSGQALLLAVLLMVFAALLGSTFITIVALNLNQTARQENLSASRSAAQAGISFINDRLTNSAEGLRWRPESVSLPPRPTNTSDFNIYYTALERAKGWTRTMDGPDAGDDRNQDGVTFGAGNAEQQREEEWLYIAERLQANRNERCFVKVPDPRGAAPNSGGPQYLAEVRADLDAAGAPTGLLKITVIGQSEDNPNAFEERVAYKSGVSRNPIVAAARTVTNWDFVNNVVPEGRVNAAVSAVNSFVLGSAKGRFPDAPFYITVGGLPVAGTATTVKSALVTNYDRGTNTLTLSLPISAIAGERVQLAAGLGSPAGVDYDADNIVNGAVAPAQNHLAPTYRREAITYSFTSAATTPARVRVNGGLVWLGNAVMSNFSTTDPTSGVSASGLMGLHGDPTGTTLPPALPRLLSVDGTTRNLRLTDSSQATFPVGADATQTPRDEAGTALGTAYVSQLRRVVADGYNRLRGVPNVGRDVSDFIPPSIANNQNGLNRFLDLTKFSRFDTRLQSDPILGSDPAIASAGPNDAGPSLYGYGQGIYIDNEDDVEKVASGARFVAMPTTRFRGMLLDQSTTGTTNREGRNKTPANIGTGAAPSAASLEEKHLRGWIGPDEFRARGTLIELVPNAINPRVIITREALQDSPAASADPVAQRVWRDASGTPIAGTYRRSFPWPANGVIFAEGNVRVKGGAFDPVNPTAYAPLLGADPQRGITIVSMNNIYIDGPLNAGPRKVALLAKKNVILNPTAALARAEGFSIATAASTGVNITVADVAAFRTGDWIDVSAKSVRITGVNPTTRVLTVDEAANVPNGSVVSVTRDPLLTATTGRVYSQFATRLGKFSDAIQRRVTLVGPGTEMRLQMRHNASLRDAARLQVASDTTPPVTSAEFTLKELTGTDKQSTIVRPVDKLLNVSYTAGTATNETFPKNATDNPPVNDAEAGVISLLNMENQMQDRGAAPVEPPLRFVDTPAADGRPTKTILGDYDYTNSNPSPTKLPTLFYFLASIGNRLDHTGPTTGLTPLLPRRKAILTAPATVPIGTSVQYFANASTAASPLVSDHLVGGVGTAFESVNQLGFNPTYGDISTNPANATEDALTIDQGFYQGAANHVELVNAGDNSNYTLDSRRINFTPSTDGINNIAITLNNDPIPATGRRVEDYFRATVGAGLSPISFYRLSRLKLEGPASPFQDIGGSLVYANNAPPFTFNVNAFVYAQEGSWMVIPTTEFDDRLKTYNAPGGAFSASYIDFNGDNIPTPAVNATDQREFLDVDNNGLISAGDGADLNRDGEVTREEHAAALRYRRYNYRVSFTGAITEGKSDTVADEGPVATAFRGSAQAAMNSWATYEFNNNNFVSTGTPKTDRLNMATFNTQAFDPTGADPAELRNIIYNYDASVASNMAFADNGFRMPATPDLIYQE